MVSFRVEKWDALAPGLENKESWYDWFRSPIELAPTLGKLPLKQIPPLLRRRFGALGRCAIVPALNIIDMDEAIPSIFSSRHGDTELTLSLLEAMGRDEEMSPTNFSLAVHNAVSGLFSIARKDSSAVTTLVSMRGLVINTLLEGIGQLQQVERVLCVIYDNPLPELYSNYCVGSAFPYAVAFTMCHEGGEEYSIEQVDELDQGEKEPLINSMDAESYMFIEMLSGLSSVMDVSINDNNWRVSKSD